MAVWEKGLKSFADEIECVRFNLGDWFGSYFCWTAPKSVSSKDSLGHRPGSRGGEWVYTSPSDGLNLDWSLQGRRAAYLFHDQKCNIWRELSCFVKFITCRRLLAMLVLHQPWRPFDLQIGLSLFFSGLSLQSSCSDVSKLSYALSGTAPKTSLYKYCFKMKHPLFFLNPVLFE